MLNQAVLVGRAVVINAYNQYKNISVEIDCGMGGEPIPVHILNHDMATSFKALVKEGDLVGVKGVVEYVDGFGMNFYVHKFSVLEENEGQ